MAVLLIAGVTFVAYLVALGLGSLALQVWMVIEGLLMYRRAREAGSTVLT